ncbi:hypothetical protein JKP88DRAFT_242702 [Tribonema minus]|uniref:Uncharacterized protein n=1 Tax=Tribonema minus TaxID=303371 RepID=A0A835ZH93_9STRA|nr:hypothetical protein JKP88DRAFT_242702 [Tribonema minus]
MQRYQSTAAHSWHAGYNTPLNVYNNAAFAQFGAGSMDPQARRGSSKLTWSSVPAAAAAAWAVVLCMLSSMTCALAWEHNIGGSLSKVMQRETPTLEAATAGAFFNRRLPTVCTVFTAVQRFEVVDEAASCSAQVAMLAGPLLVQLETVLLNIPRSVLCAAQVVDDADVLALTNFIARPCVKASAIWSGAIVLMQPIILGRGSWLDVQAAAEGTAAAVIEGERLMRIFSVAAGGRLSMGAVTLSNGKAVSNTTADADVSGGAIMAASGSEVVLVNTQLKGNNATRDKRLSTKATKYFDEELTIGGAIALLSEAHATLTNCVFKDNYALQQATLRKLLEALSAWDNELQLSRMAWCLRGRKRKRGRSSACKHQNCRWHWLSRAMFEQMPKPSALRSRASPLRTMRHHALFELLCQRPARAGCRSHRFPVDSPSHCYDMCGGGITVGVNATANVTGCSFSQGRAIFALSDRVHLYRIVIGEMHATHCCCCHLPRNCAGGGGAIHLDSDAVVYIVDTSLDSNVAVTGGAIYSSGVIHVVASNFTRNSAVSGGDIYTGRAVSSASTGSSAVQVYVSDSTFADGNTTSKVTTKAIPDNGYGGSMIIGPQSDQDSCLMIMLRSTVRGYMADGWGVVNTKCNTTISGCTIKDNRAPLSPHNLRLSATDQQISTLIVHIGNQHHFVVLTGSSASRKAVFSAALPVESNNQARVRALRCKYLTSTPHAALNLERAMLIRSPTA